MNKINKRSREEDSESLSKKRARKDVSGNDDSGFFMDQRIGRYKLITNFPLEVDEV